MEPERSYTKMRSTGSLTFTSAADEFVAFDEVADFLTKVDATNYSDTTRLFKYVPREIHVQFTPSLVRGSIGKAARS